MKHNHLRAALLSLALAAILLALSACVGSGNPADTTPDTPSDTGETDAPTTSETDAPAEVALTLSVADQKGSAIPGAVLTVTNAAGEQKATLTTDAEGAATVTLPVGDYTVSFEELPEYHLAGSTTLTVSEGMEPVALTVTNNTPDGSEEHPFFLNTETTTVTFAAETTYYFSLFAGDRRSISIENAADITVTLNGTAHTPDETGVIRVPLTEDKQQNHLSLAVTSKTAQDVTIAITAEPGSTDNPIAAEAGVDIVVEVPKDTIMYYTFTAEYTGSLTLSTADTINNISMTNKNTSEATNFSNGSTEPLEIGINTGDVIIIAVSTVGGDTSLPAQTITFRLMQEIM